MGKILTPTFDRSVGFHLHAQMMGIRKFFATATAINPNLAIPKKEIWDMIGGALHRGYMTPEQALPFLSANILQHEHSAFNEYDYLPCAITLYNAKDMAAIHKAENCKEGSADSDRLWRVYNNSHGTRQDRIKDVRRYCYMRDIEKGSAGFVLGRLLGRHQTIEFEEIEGLLKQYKPREENGKREELNQDGTIKKTYSAIDLSKILPILRNQRSNNFMTESQCGLFLCFSLHSLERRRKDDSFYVNHPMAVAGLVQKYGAYVLKDERKVWQATIVALLHDIGEKSNFVVRKDLKGLLSETIANAVISMDKLPDQTYFAYVEDIAQNPLGAFVKLCDIVHNSSDGGESPSLRQKFVYPLAAAYLKHTLLYPEAAQNLTIRDFALGQGLCSEEDFERIVNLAKKDCKDDGKGISLDLPVVTEDILKDFITQEHHANPRREKGISLHR